MPGTAYLFYPQTPCKINVSETFYLKHHFDTHFDKTHQNQAFHYFSHHEKSPLFHSKIPSNPWKISILSNLTENTIFNKEITHQKPSIYNSLITQNTSKSNTFHYTQSANNIHLSKSYFLSLTPYQKFTSTHQDHTTHQSQSTKQYHTPHSLPAIIGLNQWKWTHFHTETTSMIKYSPKNKNQNLPSKTQI